MIAVDPAEVVEIVLRSDKSKPRAACPAFLAHAPTVRESLKIGKLLDEHGEEATAPERRVEVLTEILGILLSGWRNVADREGKPVDFDIAKLDDLLSPREKIELFNAALDIGNVPEKKSSNSESPQAGGTESSAPTAAAESAGPPHQL